MSISDEALERIKDKIKQELDPLFTNVPSMSDKNVVEFGEEVRKFTKNCNDAINTYSLFALSSPQGFTYFNQRTGIPTLSVSWNG